MENSGFEIVSKKWLEEYPKFKNNKNKSFIEKQKKLAGEVKSNPAVFFLLEQFNLKNNMIFL